MASVKNNIKKIKQEDFLHKCFIDNEIPETLDIDVFVVGLLDEVIDDNCVFLAEVCKYLDPLHVFEIGTSSGLFATICAQNSNALITTTSLAKEYNKFYDNIGKQSFDLKPVLQIGSIYRVNGKQSRVRQLFLNSFQINLELFYKKEEIDLAIINGAKDAKFVCNDSIISYEFLRYGGVILWNKYETEKNVREGIKLFSKEMKLQPKYIDGTNWAALIK